ncbi:hypothetical protein [Bacillus cereus]|uniref:hypothetical protein n=1 Tax=Bacillus cereus TaxID=1396 RepID=UPI001C8CD6A8|nr:hypothetical protein [Bacillus cereus]MBX9158768.1 hypothetical protein [Bacillus cereus]
MYDVLAVVEYGESVALVLDKPVEFSYQKHGDVIIGRDASGAFVRCFEYSKPKSGGTLAFGGKEFDITLENGEVIHCYGQWWSGGYEVAAKVLNKELVDVVYKDKESLGKSYEFSGCLMLKEQKRAWLQRYTGKVYGYSEYGDILKGKQTA